ncbi:hypothetical protein ES705_34632 [subsurface metagenome]
MILKRIKIIKLTIDYIKPVDPISPYHPPAYLVDSTSIPSLGSFIISKLSSVRMVSGR